MTYVTEQTSGELRAHMRRLQAMPGWHNPLDDRLYREILDQDAEIKRLKAKERADIPPGMALVPIEPTTAMLSAMACSKARDAEGEFPALMDLIDYSGENKTHTVLKAAYQAMLAASQDSAKETK